MIRDLLRLVRWENLLMTILVLLLMEKLVAVPILDKALFPEVLPHYIILLICMAVVFIQAGGNVINDYFDIKIDAINRPERLIVSRSISKTTAMLLHQVLSAIGIVAGLAVAVVLRSWSLGLIFLFVPGLLWFYSSSYKRQFMVGNLIVSLAAALTPFVIAIANVAYLELHFSNVNGYNVLADISLTHDIYLSIGIFSVFAFISTWVREIEKDMQDQEGDRELECHTMPVKWGEKSTKVFVSLLILVMATMLCYVNFRLLPYPHGWQSVTTRYLVFGLLIPIACNLYVLWKAKISSDYRNAQLLTKAIMVIGMFYSVVFAISYAAMA